MQKENFTARCQAALRGTWLDIDLGVMEQNVDNIAAFVGGKEKIIAVLKGDAYGFGLVECGKALARFGIGAFAVATLREAEKLRDAGVKDAEIILLGLTPPSLAEAAVRLDTMPVVDSLEDAEALGKAALAAGTECQALLALDTGMGRIGLLAEDPSALDDAIAIARVPGLRLRGLFSHLSTADDEDTSFCEVQIPRYEAFLKKAQEAGIAEAWDRSNLASSPSILERPEIYYDRVRAGSLLFGLYPEGRPGVEPFPLTPIMEWRAYFTKVKTVPAGTPISYSRLFTTERESRIGTLPFGSADGYPRTALNKCHVLVNGQKAPIVGTICMDQCMVDLTDLPDVKPGDEAVVVGVDGDQRIHVDDIAAAAGLSHDEVICDLTMRLSRLYHYKGESWWETK